MLEDATLSGGAGIESGTLQLPDDLSTSWTTPTASTSWYTKCLQCYKSKFPPHWYSLWYLFWIEWKELTNSQGRHQMSKIGPVPTCGEACSYFTWVLMMVTIQNKSNRNVFQGCSICFVGILKTMWCPTTFLHDDGNGQGHDLQCDKQEIIIFWFVMSMPWVLKKTCKRESCFKNMKRLKKCG